MLGAHSVHSASPRPFENFVVSCSNSTTAVLADRFTDWLTAVRTTNPLCPRLYCESFLKVTQTGRGRKWELCQSPTIEADEKEK